MSLIRSNNTWTNLVQQCSKILALPRATQASPVANNLWGNMLKPWKQLWDNLDLNDSILKAVPKKKTTYGKKRMRASGKALKKIENIVPCTSCGQPKLMHHLCQNCYKDLRGRIRAVRDAIQN
jgi:large subunit ribosomal protein L32